MVRHETGQNGLQLIQCWVVVHVSQAVVNCEAAFWLGNRPGVNRCSGSNMLEGIPAALLAACCLLFAAHARPGQGASNFPGLMLRSASLSCTSHNLRLLIITID